MQQRIIKTDASKQTMSVLFAEDDPFQRNLIYDLLGCANYKVIQCENGIQARNELLNSENQIDLILLDLYMPELDGLELLKLIQKIEKLKEIPVVMMSGDSDNNIVANCLNSGAIDYIVKPITYKKMQTLAELVKRKPKPPESRKDKETYSIVRKLGQGAFGSVELVRRSSDQEQFALKIIPLYYMNDQEKKNAENEVSLLKVLIAPTIIKYHESFIEEDCLNIIMEYAEGGSVYDRILEHRNKGNKIPKDQVLSWMAQLVIAIHFMHGKNILHRDIKTQNMFLNKDNVIKLGDFGISKSLGTHANFAQTSLGTPYFMPPEIIRGDKYDQKADIWALGCALYEIVYLKRPFEHDVVQSLFQLIQTQPHNTDAEVDKDLALLIDMMLQKEPQKRPFISDLASIHCIEEKINQFYEQHPHEKNQISAKVVKANEEDTETNDQMDQNPALITIELMENIQYRLVCQGLINQTEYVCVSGADIFAQLQNQFNNKSEEDVKQVSQLLLESKWLQPLENQRTLVNSNYSYYSFPMFLTFIPANVQQKYTLPSSDLLSLSEKLIKNLKYFQLNCKVNQTISEEKLIENFKSYIHFCQETQALQKGIMIDYTAQKKIAVYLNIYQIMRTHQYLQKFYAAYLKRKRGLIKESRSVLKTIIGTILPPHQMEDEFSYMIGETTYSMQEIKHGILRDNKPAPKFQQWPKNDQRIIPVDIIGIVTLFVEDYPDTSILDVIGLELNYVDESNLQQFIQRQIKSFISKYVCFDQIEKEMIIHPFLQNYVSDFGKGLKDLLQWILNNFGKKYNNEQVLKQFDDKELYIRFKDPNVT